MKDYKEYTQTEWTKIGKELYGEDFLTWKFKCPMCGNIQTPADFKKYKDDGATPDSARCECIGRYMSKDECSKAFGDGTIKSPCDYAAYGLIRIGHKITFDNGSDTYSFPFAEEKED